jgi:hypothetical protein
MHLHVSAFEFELGDVLLDQKLYEFFDFFLVHVMYGRKVVLRVVGPDIFPLRLVVYAPDYLLDFQVHG